MCGIIGYFGGKNASEIALKGLRRLEYRGYDSFGFALQKKTGAQFTVLKKVGAIENFKGRLSPSSLALAHTRWATHGGVSEKNAHPHLSNDKSIAVVHNGIVENYLELKKFLKKKGYRFRSETDTEVIPNMIQFFMKSRGKNFPEAVKLSLKKMKGYYAVVAMQKNFSGLIGARNGSPLVLGIGNSEFFLASDVTAFLEFTHKTIFLDDNEMAIVGAEGTKIIGLKKNKKVSKKIQSIKWSVEQAKKGKYKHFTLKEINEQAFTIKEALEQPTGLVDDVAKSIRSAFGVFFVGCGTSYHSCVSASYVFSKVAKKHVNVVIASEFRNYEHFLTPKTLVVAVSQSGETADLLDAVKFAKKKRCKVISIVNVMGSSLMRLSEKTLLMNSGPEIGVVSTKSYTAQLAILLLLAYAVAGKKQQGKKLVSSASAAVPSIIRSTEPGIRRLAKKIKRAGHMFLIGRDLAFPTALEGALKVKEICYIHAEGFAGAELKHGTIALIEKGTPCIVISTDRTRELILSNATELKSRGAFIIGIDSKPNEVFHEFIKVKEFLDASPIVDIIPIQLLSYYLAVERKCNPDKPRNLAKSVTVK
ncbi:MAG: glutamine--fructose-6-phosphate transaminase (isomerizing) [Candidatus Diapherotrites archaeon]